MNEKSKVCNSYTIINDKNNFVCIEHLNIFVYALNIHFFNRYFYRALTIY